jgi:hypothetical protein
VDHVGHPYEGVGRQWRTGAIVAGGVAALELLLLVAAGITLFGRPLAHDVRREAIKHESVAAAVKAKPRPAATLRAPAIGKPTLARSQTSVLVLNGNGRSGAAGGEADRVRNFGYIVGGVGNARRSDYPRTIVMYRPGYRAEGARFAHDLHLKTFSPLDGVRRSELMGAHLVVVVGAR